MGLVLCWAFFFFFEKRIISIFFLITRENPINRTSYHFCLPDHISWVYWHLHTSSSVLTVDQYICERINPRFVLFWHFHIMFKFYIIDLNVYINFIANFRPTLYHWFSDVKQKRHGLILNAGFVLWLLTSMVNPILIFLNRKEKLFRYLWGIIQIPVHYF